MGTFPKPAGAMAFPYCFYTVVGTKRKKGQGSAWGKALPPLKLRKTAASGNWNGRWGRGVVSCGAVHSQARELVTHTLVAISRSSVYYQKKPRGNQADRAYDEQIVMACGEKPAYGYRRVTWWLRREEGLTVNQKRVMR